MLQVGCSRPNTKARTGWACRRYIGVSVLLQSKSLPQRWGSPGRSAFMVGGNGGAKSIVMLASTKIKMRQSSTITDFYGLVGDILKVDPLLNSPG